MKTLFDAADRTALEQRLHALQASNVRQWGKMNVAQALAHCSAAMEMACGDRQKKQALIGKLLMPFIKSSMLGDKPFSKNGPTDPDLIVADERDFAVERARLVAMVDRFCKSGSEAAGRQIHSFFGRLSGEEWGRLMYKHIDHHLRQFGA